MIRVRFRPLELMAVAEEKEYPNADAYDIMDDNTIVLYQRWQDTEGKKHRFIIGHVNKDRWDDIELMEEAEES